MQLFVGELQSDLFPAASSVSSSTVSSSRGGAAHPLVASAVDFSEGEVNFVRLFERERVGRERFRLDVDGPQDRLFAGRGDRGRRNLSHLRALWMLGSNVEPALVGSIALVALNGR